MEHPAFTPNIIEAPDEEVMTTGRAGGLRKAPKRGCKTKSNLQFVAAAH